MKHFLTIGRRQSVDAKKNNKILIEVKDENFNTVFETTIDAEKFTLALTGLAFQECNVTHNWL